MIKEIDNTRDYIKELTRVYDRFNKHFWNNELPEVIITIVPTKKAYGHFTPYKSWIDKSDNDNWKYEINISSLTICRSPKEVCETMLHEQVHCYCCIHGIEDTSNHGKYHNGKFRSVAEEHGYIIKEKTSPSMGWSNGEFSPSAYYYFKRLNVKQCKFERIESHKPSYNPLIKYQCPECGAKCWCSKECSLICGDCLVELIMMSENRKKKKM